MKIYYLFVLILTFTPPAFGNYYKAEDFQGPSNLDYKYTLNELETELKEIIQNIKHIQKNLPKNTSSNVYFNSIFNKEVEQVLIPLQKHIKVLPKKIDYLALELNTTYSRFLNFEFPHIEMLSDQDRKIFEDIKKQITEDVARHYKTSSQIILTTEQLENKLSQLFLRKKKVSKHIYIEYMVMSETDRDKIFNLLIELQSLHNTIIDHENGLNTHRRTTNNIFDSFKRKLAFSLNVKSALSFHSAFHTKVLQPMKDLREKILKDASVLNVEKNAFTYNYYLNQLYRALDYSKALNFIGPDYLPEHRLGQYRAHEQAIDFKLGDYFEKPGAIRSLISFLEAHYSTNNQCRLIF